MCIKRTTPLVIIYERRQQPDQKCNHKKEHKTTALSFEQQESKKEHKTRDKIRKKTA